MKGVAHGYRHAAGTVLTAACALLALFIVECQPLRRATRPGRSEAFEQRRRNAAPGQARGDGDDQLARVPGQPQRAS